MRSALDYIAWELAGARPDDASTMFPVYLDRHEFQRHHRKRIGKLPQAVQDLIESMQPYHARHPALSAVWAIHELDRADKHRLLTVTVVAPHGGGFSFDGMSGCRIRPHIRIIRSLRFEHDEVVAVITLSEPMPAMNVKATLDPDIAFGEGLGFGAEAGVISGLDFMLQELRVTISRFESLFSAGDQPNDATSTAGG